MQGVGRLKGAGFVETGVQFRFRQRRQAETTRNELARPDGVIGASDDEFDLCRTIRLKPRLEGEARCGIESPDLAFVVEFAPSPGFASGRPGERTFAEKARARVLVADEFGRGVRLDREKGDFASVRTGRAQEAVAGHNRVQPANEYCLDMHSRK